MADIWDYNEPVTGESLSAFLKVNPNLGMLRDRLTRWVQPQLADGDALKIRPPRAAPPPPGGMRGGPPPVWWHDFHGGVRDNFGQVVEFEDDDAKQAYLAEREAAAPTLAA